MTGSELLVDGGEFRSIFDAADDELVAVADLARKYFTEQAAPDEARHVQQGHSDPSSTARQANWCYAAVVTTINQQRSSGVEPARRPVRGQRGLS